VDRKLYDRLLRNLHAWAGHLEPLIERATTQAAAELGPPGETGIDDARRAAEALAEVGRGIGEVMAAYDLVLDASDRPRRFDDFLQGLATAPGSEPEPEPGVGAGADGASALEISRSRFARLVAELHYDCGWLAGAIHGAMISDEERLDAHLDGLAAGIEELMVSYDRLQDVLGVTPARHSAFLGGMVVLEEEPRRRRTRPPV
jgi:hypothetical protein